VSLTRPTSTFVKRIGEPTGRATGVRFYQWIHLEQSASRVVEHHPRCFLIEPDALRVPAMNAAIRAARTMRPPVDNAPSTRNHLAPSRAAHIRAR
jgi:hypothetical protein